MITERVLMGLLLGGIAIGCALVLKPFLSAIVWAAILVFTTWPVFAWLRGAVFGRVGLGKVGAALAMVLLTAVMVVLPIALAVPGGANDVNHLSALVMDSVRDGLPMAPSWLGRVPLVGPTLSNLWNSWAADLSAMFAFFQPWLGTIAEGGIALLLGIANGIVSFLLALFIAFFFFLYGDSMGGRIKALIRRIAGGQADRLISVTGLTVRGTVIGILGTAAVQGLLTLFGLWLSGVPRAGLLALVAGSLSVLPIGAPVVWIPAFLWLLSRGQTAWGVFLAIYGLFFITGSDHVIRPYFIARGAKLPFLLTVLGVLGGALAFGLLGIFLGPVLLGVAYTLVVEFAGVVTPVVVARRPLPPPAKARRL